MVFRQILRPENAREPVGSDSRRQRSRRLVLVSAIIPVYNGAATIAEAVDSVLAQPVDGLEIIVVDDGSTDSTRIVLEGYGTRIKVFAQSNRGVSAACNAAVGVSSG